MGRRKKKSDGEPDLVIGPIPEAIRKALDDKEETRRGNGERCTPEEILRNALRAAYGVNTEDRGKYRDFVSKLMRGLSRLVTSGSNDEIFEPDFNTFMTIVVRAINECGEMLSILEENGIDYVPRWRRDEEEDDEDDGEDYD